MSDRSQGKQGIPGVQGVQGLPSSECFLNHFPLIHQGRWIGEGGSRSLSPTDSIIIIDSEEKVSLHLPDLPERGSLAQDFLYTPVHYRIYIIQGFHSIKSKTKINKILTSVDLDNSTVFEFVSGPSCWYMTFYTCK